MDLRDSAVDGFLSPQSERHQRPNDVGTDECERQHRLTVVTLFITGQRPVVGYRANDSTGNATAQNASFDRATVPEGQNFLMSEARLGNLVAGMLLMVKVSLTKD